MRVSARGSPREGLRAEALARGSRGGPRPARGVERPPRPSPLSGRSTPRRGAGALEPELEDAALDVHSAIGEVRVRSLALALPLPLPRPSPPALTFVATFCHFLPHFPVDRGTGENPLRVLT